MNKYEDIDEILGKYGYKRCENTKCKIDPTAGASTNYCRDMNSDIKNGFQDVDPMFIAVFFEYISNVLSSEMPSLQANAFGNWLQTLAAAILTFNGQQQYYQGGSVRYYNPAYRNVSNPFAENQSHTDGEEEFDSKKKRSRSVEVKKLNSKIDALEQEVSDLKNLVRELLNRR
ncbi:MAG: hypothetical protein E7214_08515 [Clostridium sp.]|nr:hypothetical protein [Clostridium sp.]